MHIGNGAVERAIQTMKNLVLANMEDGNNLTGRVNRALKVMRFTIQTGLKKTPFELHHGRKTRTELTNIKKDGKSFVRLVRIVRFSTKSAQNTNICRTRRWRGKYQSHGDGQNENRRTATGFGLNHRGKETRLDIHLKLWKKDIIENP